MSKINHILKHWPQNSLITTKWLQEKGVSRQLADSYVKSGWLERFGTGAFKRPQQKVNRAVGIATLQHVCKLDVHVGGKSALEALGYAHYIRANTHQPIILWKRPDTMLPAWFVNHEWETESTIRAANLFDSNTNILTEKEINGTALGISAAEQAVLEYLYDLPQYEGFDEATYLMEGLYSLRPSVLQPLLEQCKSIKVKRLFLYFGEIYVHAWFKRLDISNIDLGKGKRTIVKGGSLDKTYQIVVPDIKREDQ